MQGQPQSPELTGATVWTRSPPPLLEGGPGQVQTLPNPQWGSLPAGAWCSGGSGEGGPQLRSANPSWSWGCRPWQEPTASPGDKALSREKPNPPLFSLPWSWKENPVYLPRFTKTLRSRDAQKVCTELKLPPFNSLVHLFIQQILMTYPL